MKRIQVILPVLALGAALTAQQPAARKSVVPDDAPPGFVTITADELREHAGYLASDALGGRLTGSPGQMQAAEYVAKHFGKLGLKPLGDKKGSKRGWYQRYSVVRTYLLPKTSLKAAGKTFKKGFAVIAAKGQDGDKAKDVSAAGVLVYAGRVGGRGGNVDVGGLRGKIPVVVLKAARVAGVAGQFRASFSILQRMGGKARALANDGARAVVFCLLDDDAGLSSALTTYALLPGKDLVARGRGGGRSGQVAKTSTPWIITSREISVSILEALKLNPQEVLDPLAEATLKASRKTKPRGKVVVAVRRDAKASAVNVCAVLRGSDKTLRSEAVVYSAHMDHIGMRLDGDAFNGADDNASGTAALMEIAQAFAGTQPPPKRSVIFLAVSGEEMGLWGSAHYADNPTWPVKKITANINTDMIGRSGPESGPDEVTVTPSYRHARFSTMVRDAAGIARKLGLGLSSGDKYYQRSDHYNFAKKGIPVVFFCYREHPDYHQVTDHVDTLDPVKMERVTRLAYWTGWLVTQANRRPRTLGSQKSWLRGQ
jgi:hypothetical protein